MAISVVLKIIQYSCEMRKKSDGFSSFEIVPQGNDRAIR